MAATIQTATPRKKNITENNQTLVLEHYTEVSIENAKILSK